MSKNPHLSRNEFVKVTVGALGTVIGTTIAIPAVGYVVSPALQQQESDTWISLGPLENYPIGVPTLFSFTRSKINGWEKTVNSYGVFVLRDSETNATVLSNVCTHLGCRVNWVEADQEYFCPCHNAAFYIDGKVKDGPPPRPMDRYETKVEEGNLFIHLVG